MFNSGYSLADISAATGNNNNGMWGDGAWWIIILLLFGGRGWGGYGSGGGVADSYVLNSDFATIQRQLSDGFGGVEKGIDTIRNGLCDGFYTEAQLVNGVNTNILTSTNTLQGAIKDCCCQTQQNIKDTQYAIATNANMVDRSIADGFCKTNFNMQAQNNATLQAIDKVGDRIIDHLNADKMQTLRDENQALRLTASQAAQNDYLVSQLRPCPSPAYVVPNPYGCNCGYNGYGYYNGTTFA